MQTNPPLPVDRVIQPPNTDKIKQEDEEAERRVDEARKEAPKEPFDTHLNRVMPPGWAPSPEHAALDLPQLPQLLSSAFRPGWLMNALGELDRPLPVSTGPTSAVVLHVPQVLSGIDDRQVLEAVKQGAPIHEAHFPNLFVAQVSQMQAAGVPVTHLAVQIAPEDLGQLQLHFTLREQVVTVSVLAANQQAKESLERQLNAIQAILSAHHFKPSELKVEVANQGQGSQQQGQGGERDSSPYQTPNRWMMKRGDLEDELDVGLG